MSRWNFKDKLGGVFGINVVDEYKLSHTAQLGVLASEMMETRHYKEVLKYVILKRREQIISEIKNPANKEEFERLAGRLEENDSIEMELINLINKGNEAIKQLNELKETQNV